jgi:hypothetical protein
MAGGFKKDDRKSPATTEEKGLSDKATLGKTGRRRQWRPFRK